MSVRGTRSQGTKTIAAMMARNSAAPTMTSTESIAPVALTGSRTKATPVAARNGQARLSRPRLR